MSYPGPARASFTIHLTAIASFLCAEGNMKDRRPGYVRVDEAVFNQVTLKQDLIRKQRLERRADRRAHEEEIRVYNERIEGIDHDLADADVTEEEKCILQAERCPCAFRRVRGLSVWFPSRPLSNYVPKY